MRTYFEIINDVLERVSGCETAITVPEGVVMLDEITWDCPPIKNIKLPNSLRIIDSYAFEDCDSLKELTLPPNTVTIGNRAFIGCSGLEKITIPEKLTTIGEEAFCSCISLKEIIIPAACVLFGEKIFRDCRELSSIKVSPDNDLYDSRDNCNAVIRKHSNTLLAGCYNTVIPKSVNHIGQGAFYECKKLSRIVLHDNIVSVGRDAFGGCSNLKSADISQSVTEIGDRAFWNCPSLETLVIADSVKKMGNDVFYMCPSLRKVHVKKVTGDKKAAEEIFRQTGISPETTIKNAVADNDIDFIIDYGNEYITNENIDYLIGISAEKKCTEVSAFLLKLKHIGFSSSDEDYL